jgi:hypothetical protein
MDTRILFGSVVVLDCCLVVTVAAHCVITNTSLYTEVVHRINIKRKF